jgi:hypothetical protein
MTQGKLAQCFSTWRAIAAYIRPMRQRVAQLQAKQAAREGREALQGWRHAAHLGHVSRVVRGPVGHAVQWFLRLGDPAGLIQLIGVMCA